MKSELCYDLVVAGGGFAGACAAIAAAREGLRVLLIEKYNCLGGAACANLVSPFMIYWTKYPGDADNTYLSRGIFEEILHRLYEETGLDGDFHKSYFDEEILKLVLNRMALEAGVELLYNTHIHSANTENGRIVSVECGSRGRVFTVAGENFIDATGDGELSYMAGAEFRLGRPEDNLCQPMTLCFRMSGVDKKTFEENREKINPLYQEFQKEGKIRNPRENVLIFDNFNDGVLHFNTTRVVRLDPTDPFDVTQAEVEAREQVFEIWRFLKENIKGFEKSRVLSTAIQIGARESRMIEGDYVLTVQDLKALTRFDDAITLGRYEIDIHNPAGTGTSHYFFKEGEVWSIPYRCLLVKGFANLLTAGRCISTDHEAQAAYRIMPIVANIGEAAGYGVAVAHKAGVTPREADVAEIQTLLRRGGIPL